MDTSEVYRAVPAGDIEFLKANKSEIGSFASCVAKNTILHIYIITRSKREKEKEKTKLQKRVISFKSWFKEPPPAAAAPPSPGDTVRAMLEEWPLLLRKANENGDTPLHMAARHGHCDIVKVLIEPKTQAEPSNQLEEEVGQRAVWEMLHEANADKETALHQAVRYGHTKVAQALIDADEPSFLYLPNKYEETPLYMAAERENWEVVDLILAKYTSPAYQGPEGTTALHVASDYDYGIGEAIMKKKGLEFLATKVDDRGRTPLHYMSMSVLHHDKSAAFVFDNDGNAPIHIAASKGFTWRVEQFLEECPECFELVDKQGRNALHLAILGGNIDAANLILHSELLCDLLKSKDNNGDTPLHLVAKSNNYEDYHWPEAIEDPRFDQMAIVSLACDLSRRIDLSNTEMRMEMCMNKAGIWASRLRLLLDMDSDTKNVKESSQGQINGPPEEDILKEERQSHLVVAALIATVTFAAGFTLPGGYNQDDGANQGYAILTKSSAFVAFVITDTFGLVFSCAAVFIHLLIAMDRYKESTIVRKLFGKALPITLLAIIAMVIAFITGTYAVLGHARSLAVSASVIGGLFFFLLGYLAEEARESSSFPIFRWTLRGPLHAVVWLLETLLYYLLIELPDLIDLAFSPIVELINRCCSRKEDKNQRASELDHMV